MLFVVSVTLPLVRNAVALPHIFLHSIWLYLPAMESIMSVVDVRYYYYFAFSGFFYQLGSSLYKCNVCIVRFTL